MAERRTIDEHLADIFWERCSAAIVDLPATLNPETAPASLLPWIGWAHGLQYMLTSWDEATQRSVVAEAVRLVRERGTPAALMRAVESAGGLLNLVEWWQHPDGILERGTWLAEAEADPGSILVPLEQREYVEAIRLVVPLSRPGNVGVVVRPRTDIRHASRARIVLRVTYT